MAYASYETSPLLTPPPRPPQRFLIEVGTFTSRVALACLGIKGTFIFVLNKHLKCFLLSVLVYTELRYMFSHVCVLPSFQKGACSLFSVR